jgi:hypothetical protein
MFINNCRQTKRSQPVEKPVTALRPIKLIKANSFVEQYPLIAAAMDKKLEAIKLEQSIRKAFEANRGAIGTTKRELRLAADAILAEYGRREMPAMIGSTRRK